MLFFFFGRQLALAHFQPSLRYIPLRRLRTTEEAAQPPLLGRRHPEATRRRRFCYKIGGGQARSGLCRPQDAFGPVVVVVVVVRARRRTASSSFAVPKPPGGPPASPRGRRSHSGEGRARGLCDPRRREARAFPASVVGSEGQRRRRRRRRQRRLRLHLERGALGRPGQRPRRSRRRGPPGRGGFVLVPCRARSFFFFFFSFAFCSLPAEGRGSGARGERRAPAGREVDEDRTPLNSGFFYIYFLSLSLSPSFLSPLLSSFSFVSVFRKQYR